jgi:hypothetical protein
VTSSGLTCQYPNESRKCAQAYVLLNSDVYKYCNVLRYLKWIYPVVQTVDVMDLCQLRLKTYDKLNIAMCNALVMTEWGTPELTVVEISVTFLLSRKKPTNHKLQTVYNFRAARITQNLFSLSTYWSTKNV